MVVAQREPGSALPPILGSGPGSGMETEISTSPPKMVAKAILICRPNSHPFQERTLLLDQPIKVGRAVARARPAQVNAIFDCKVLSRNHALLWYETGKFFLQDTKSSNGTFVNNQRLSKGSEESVPREVSSGDIVQFGVDVMENSRKGKVTHGCIVATLKLYLPDGKEAKASPSTTVVRQLPATIPSSDLYQLSQYLQEALHREQMLENKLATLQRLVSTTQEASQAGWKALIDEDRLLTRLEILESQLQTYSKTMTEDKLRDELNKMHQDKDTYQMTAKESLHKALEEKVEVLRKLQDVERSVSNAEDDNVHLREQYENMQEELKLMSEKYTAQTKEVTILQEKIQEFEKDQLETTSIMEEEKRKLEEQLDDLGRREDSLNAKIESLEADNDFSKEQYVAIKAHLDTIKNESIDDEMAPWCDSRYNSVVELNMSESETDVEEDVITSGSTQDLKVALNKLQEEKDKVKRHHEETERELQQARNRINDLEAQLQESQSQKESTNQHIKALQDRLHGLEDEIKSSSSPNSDLIREVSRPTSIHVNGLAHTECSGENATDLAKLQELLEESREKKLQADKEAQRFKGDLEEATGNLRQLNDEIRSVRQQLLIAQQQCKDKTEATIKLQDQLAKSEQTMDDSHHQVTALQEFIEEEKQKVLSKEKEADLLQEQLLTAQQALKQSQNEAEQLRSKVEALTDVLEQKVAAVRDSDSTGEYRGLKEECHCLKSRIQAIEAEMKDSRGENAKLLADYHTLQEAYLALSQSSSSSNMPPSLLAGSSLQITSHSCPGFSSANNVVSSNESSESDAGSPASEDGLRQRRVPNVQTSDDELGSQHSSCTDEKKELEREIEILREQYQSLSYQTQMTGRKHFLIAVLVFIVALLLWSYRPW